MEWIPYKFLITQEEKKNRVNREEREKCLTVLQKCFPIFSTVIKGALFTYSFYTYVNGQRFSEPNNEILKLEGN